MLRLAKLFQLSLEDLLLEDSVIVKEIQRREQIVKLRGVYYLGPVLTGILLIMMMYLPKPTAELLLPLITLASLTNLFTLFYFKFNLASLKGKKEKVQRELRQMKIIMAVSAIAICIFLIYLYSI